jgi:hypothetical protein
VGRRIENGTGASTDTQQLSRKRENYDSLLGSEVDSLASNAILIKLVNLAPSIDFLYTVFFLDKNMPSSSELEVTAHQNGFVHGF